MSSVIAEMFAAFSTNIRIPHIVVLIVGTSFITYRIFKRFEPDDPIPVGFLLVVIPSLLVPFLRLCVPSLPLAVGITFTSYYALILSYIAAYRLSPFHPLAKYPGPIANKLCKITMAYVSSTGKQHLYYMQLHKHYGDIVRIGPNELSVNCVDAIQPVLGTGGLSKGPFWYNRVPKGRPRALIATHDPIEHKRRRKTWDRAFSTAAIKNYNEIIVKRARELVEQFERRAGHEIDLSMWMSYFSYDFMGETAFGIGFNMIRTGHDAAGVWETMENAMKLSTIIAHIPWLFTYIRLIPDVLRRKRTFQLAEEYMNQRVAEGSDIKDLMYYLTDEEGLEPVKPSMPVVYSDGVLAIIAGADTTATTLTALWYYLLLDPTTADRLRREVDIYFPPGEEPVDFTRMVNMPFLNACINEALRLVPPVISGSQRSTKSEFGGRMIGPYFIPEGNQVLNHTFSLHRNPRYFSPYPDTFWPDRWLPERDREKLPSNEAFILDHAAYIPFSYGPTSCVGKNMALLELRAVTCYIVQKFKFTAKKGCGLDSWEEDIKDFFVVKKPPLAVVVEPRR